LRDLITLGSEGKPQGQGKSSLDVCPHLHPPSPSKFTPICSGGLLQHKSLSTDPRALLCNRRV